MTDKRKSKRWKSLPVVIVFAYLSIAFFAPLISNEKPLYFLLNGQSYFPAFSNDPYITFNGENGMPVRDRVNNIDWKNLTPEKIIFPPVPWSPLHSDLLNVYSSPFSNQYIQKNDSLRELPSGQRHFLGTGKNGNDVLAGLIHGTKNSISIGLLSMCIAVTLGFIIGAMAGYMGDDKLKAGLGNILLSVILIIPAWFYSFHLRNDSILNSFQDSFFSGFLQLLLSLVIFIILLSIPFLLKFPERSLPGKKISIPLDSVVSRFIEIFISLPKLILILTMAAISRPSVTTIILIIGLTSWTDTARIVRAQVLQLREMNFVSAAKTFGTHPVKILFRHLLPNVLPQVLVVFIFGIASAILIETGLSFLGIGLPADTATWGSIMYEARENLNAWWLVVFSGASIFLLLSALYSIGNKLSFNRK